MNYLPFVNASGQPDWMPTDELHSVGKTHSHETYAFGAVPVYPKPWQRFVYARFRDFDRSIMCNLAGISDACLDEFLKTESLRSAVKPKHIHPRAWSDREISVLLDVRPRYAYRIIDRTYNACRAKWLELLK